MFSVPKMIVGVVGTANTGKTTFINDVLDSEWNYGRDAEFMWRPFGKDYRKVIEERGLKINRNGTENSQKIIHDILKTNITEAAYAPFPLKRLIMDRTVLDSFAYTYWHHLFGPADEKTVSPETLWLMWDDVVTLSKMFTCIIYIPLDMCDDVKVVDDKFRDTDLTYRKQMDYIFYTMATTLQCFNGVNVEEIWGTRNERVEKFLQLEKKYDTCFNTMADMMTKSPSVGRF